MSETVRWNFEAEYIQSCNCDYGCPCNFNGRPTYGNCEALIAYRVRHGTFGSTKLDGATWASGFWWPKAIHEGNGVARMYFDPGVTKEQRTAIEAIASGKHGGGVFEIFPRTFRKVHPPKVAKVDFHFDGYDSWFKVEGVGEVRSEHISNPVTHDPFEGTIHLPGGIIFKEGLVSSIKRWWMGDEDLLAVHENKNGHVAVVRYSEAGCLP